MVKITSFILAGQNIEVLFRNLKTYNSYWISIGCTTNSIVLCARVRSDFLHRGFSTVNKNGQKLKGFSR
jgi:hypothetical protein